MGLFDYFRQPDIQRGIEEFHSTQGAVLLDVRTPSEYRQGHIPGSVNLPLQDIEHAPGLPESKDSMLFVYCRSGNRSRLATQMLQSMGYKNAKNIGGIAAYSGKVESL